MTLIRRYGRNGFVVLAHESRSTSYRIIGFYKSYRRALEQLRRLQNFRNLNGDCLFSGGSVLVLPDRNVQPTDLDVRMTRLSEKL